MARARKLLAEYKRLGQEGLDLGLELEPEVALIGPAASGGMLDVPALGPVGPGVPVLHEPARMLATASRLLFDVLAGVYDQLGFGHVDDEVFRDLVIARVAEPTSLLDMGRGWWSGGELEVSRPAESDALAGRQGECGDQCDAPVWASPFGVVYRHHQFPARRGPPAVLVQVDQQWSAVASGNRASFGRARRAQPPSPSSREGRVWSCARAAPPCGYGQHTTHPRRV